MASSLVGLDGQRIKTDILVSGFIRDVMNEHIIEIPDEIIGLCFLFWFIDVCDEWDISLCDKKWVDINDSSFKLIESRCCTLFGKHIVEAGSVFTWYLKLKSKIDWGCIGIIINKKEEIDKNKNFNDYGRDVGCGCFLFITGGKAQALLYDQGIDQDYLVPVDKGTIIEITLDMDQRSIHYKINDKEFEKTTKIESLSTEFGYRLAVTFSKKGYEIELI